MPTYEYRCPAGHEFEKFQRMTDSPGAECPECGKDAQRILSGGGGLLFKGKGFYSTDYRSESYKRAAEKEKKAGRSGDGGSGDGAKDTGSKSSEGSTGAREGSGE